MSLKRKSTHAQPIANPVGRPSKPEGTAVRSNITVALSGNSLTALDSLARLEKRSRSALVVDALRAKYPSKFA
jgi:hypothetical protein